MTSCLEDQAVSHDYFFLECLGLDPCGATKQYQARAQAGWLCPGCLVILPGTGPVDIELEDRRPNNRPIDGAFGMGVVLVHREFLERLPGEVVQGELYVGKVAGDHGPLEDWACVHPVQRTIVRGTTQAGTRTCPSCGRDLYSALESDNLCPPPPEGVRIMAPGVGFCLVVRDEMMAYVDRTKWKRLRVDKLDVLDEPRDGVKRDLVP